LFVSGGGPRRIFLVSSAWVVTSGKEFGDFGLAWANSPGGGSCTDHLLPHLLREPPQSRRFSYFENSVRGVLLLGLRLLCCFWERPSGVAFATTGEQGRNLEVGVFEFAAFPPSHIKESCTRAIFPMHSTTWEVE
jgi:hypothetical protein